MLAVCSTKRARSETLPWLSVNDVLCWATPNVMSSVPRLASPTRQAIPTEPLIWVTAVRLEEQYGAPSEVLERMVSKAMQSLAQHNVVLKREQWLQHAMKAEEAQSIGTAQVGARHRRVFASAQ